MRLLSKSKIESQARLNRTRSAIRQVRQFLKISGHPTNGLKHKDLAVLFFESSGLEIVKSPMDQLLELWGSQSNENVFKTNVSFYLSSEWRIARASALKQYGCQCMKCGSTEHPSVDHIKPRSLYPQLSLDADNLQILCRPCNSSKGNRNEGDYRQPG